MTLEKHQIHKEGEAPPEALPVKRLAEPFCADAAHPFFNELMYGVAPLLSITED